MNTAGTQGPHRARTRLSGCSGRRGFGARGFSLMELLVVVVLVAVLTALILPEMRGSYDHEQVRSASRQLTRALHLAYSQAVTVQQRHRVRFDHRTSEFLVERPTRERDGSTGFYPVRDLPGSHGRIDPRIAIEIRLAGAPERFPTGQGAGSGSSLSVTRVAASGPDRDADARDDAIAFFPDGTAEAKEIVVRDGHGFGFALRVHPVTARVTLVELDPGGRR